MEITARFEGVNEVVRTLKEIEPGLIKQLQADIKNDPGLNAAMSAIRAEIPPVSRLDGNQFGYGGMNRHEGRTRYAVPKVSVSFTPAKRYYGQATHPLITIVTKPPQNAVGFEIIDMAGRGSGAQTRKGRAMINKLGPNPSRYVYRGFEKRKEGIEEGVIKIINKYAEKTNRKIRQR